MGYNVHYRNTKFALNGKSEVIWMSYNYGPANTRFDAQLNNSLFYGGSARTGIAGPKNEFFFVSKATFKNYGPQAAAVRGCTACCCDKGPVQGAYTYRWEEMSFLENVPVRVGWNCPCRDWRAYHPKTILLRTRSALDFTLLPSSAPDSIVINHHLARHPSDVVHHLAHTLVLPCG